MATAESGHRSRTSSRKRAPRARASAAAAAAEGSEGEEATTTSGFPARAPATADQSAKVP
jgi:hypothetical protein